jgi:AcrR family transcriptional regulator
MATERNMLSVGVQETGEEPDPVLDAARATVLDFGVSRATLTEVAKRAGVSRMTVYRRFQDAPTLLRALMTREFGAVLIAAQADADDVEDPLERVVVTVTSGVRRLLAQPLLLRLLEIEPELLLPYLVERLGEFQKALRAGLTAMIAEAQASGVVRRGDPAELAATVELICRGPVLAARTMNADEREAIVGELRQILVSYLS